MQKQTQEMSASEKQVRITELYHKFYDIHERPSDILEKETRFSGRDNYIKRAIKQLRALENQSYQLEVEYTNKVNHEITPLKRILDYKLDHMQRHHKEEIAAFGVNKEYILRKQQQEIQDCKRDMAEHRKKIEADAHKKIDENEEIRFAMYMAAVKHLYK